MAPVIVIVHVGLPFCVKFIAGPYLSPARPQPSAARHCTTGPTLNESRLHEVGGLYDYIVVINCTGTRMPRDSLF